MKRRYRIPAWLALAAVLLIGARLALPSIVLQQINARIAHMGDYRGHVRDVDIALWRGAYVLHDLEITKTSGKITVPFFLAQRTDIALSWRHLFRGRVVGELEFQSPVINFVDGRDQSDSQAGQGVDWREQLDRIVLFQVNTLDIHDGVVRFHNLIRQPKVSVAVQAIQAHVTNLGNVLPPKDPRRIAHLDATGRVLGTAPLEVKADFDPFDKAGDFDVHLRATGIELTRLNTLARAYAKVDFESGHGDFVLELQARDGVLDGYATPLFKDMQIFSWKGDVQDSSKNPLRIVWEATTEVVTKVFKNQPEDQFATRVPIQGRLGDRELGTLPAILGILRNAFVKAYSADFERLKPRPSRE
ncbi:DUF748 domain-containing protein [Pseudoxanthomonas composti]|nr:DUF748 domain-containing protein [Pseudoxanthomonas composti]